MSESKVTIKLLKPLGYIVIKTEQGQGLFISTSNSLIISIKQLSTLLKILLDKGFLSVKVLEGLIEEYNSFGGNDEPK